MLKMSRHRMIVKVDNSRIKVEYDERFWAYVENMSFVYSDNPVLDARQPFEGIVSSGTTVPTLSGTVLVSEIRVVLRGPGRVQPLGRLLGEEQYSTWLQYNTYNTVHGLSDDRAVKFRVPGMVHESLQGPDRVRARHDGRRQFDFDNRFRVFCIVSFKNKKSRLHIGI